MAKEVLRRRGTPAEHQYFTGNVGELTVKLNNPYNKNENFDVGGNLIEDDVATVVVHDGGKEGGYPLLREDMKNVNPSEGRDRLELGTASLYEVEDHISIPEEDRIIIPKSGLGHAAFLDVHTKDSGNLVKLGSVPYVIDTYDGRLLYNLPPSENSLNATYNMLLSNIRNLEDENKPAQMLINGFVDAFENDSAIDTSASTISFNTSTNAYENTLSSAGVLQSNIVSSNIQPRLVTVFAIVDFGTADLTSDMSISVSRDAGVNFNTKFFKNMGNIDYPATSKKALVATIPMDPLDPNNLGDIQPPTPETDVIWKIDIGSASPQIKIYSIALSWDGDF